MKLNNKFLYAASALFMGLATTSCVDDQDWSTDASHSRLFGVKESITVTAEDTQAEISFKSNATAKYLVEISKDSLYDDIAEGTPAFSKYIKDKDGNETFKAGKEIIGTITGLIGDTKYYLRIKAKADGMTDSKWVYYKRSNGLGYFKTKAEQIFNEVADADRSENAIRLTWDATKEVTAISVYKSSEKVDSIALDATAIAAGEYTVTNLNPSTTYKFMIWLGEAKRGELSVATTAAMPAGDYKYTLGNDVTIISADLLKGYAAKAAEDGKTNYSVTIGIPAGATLDFHGTSESDGGATNITVPDGMAITFFGLAGGSAPTIKFQKNIDLEGSHSYVAFENVNVVDDGAGYFVNQTKACGVGEFSIKDCEISGFSTSFFRFQKSDAKNIDKLTLTNSIFHDMCSGYSFLHIDAEKGAGGGVKNIYMDGCTLYNIATGGKMFIYSRETAMENISVKNCTFYNCIGSGNYWVDFGNADTGCSETFEFVNCLFTKTPDEATNKNLRSSNTVVFDGCYKTNDFFKVFSGCGELDYAAGDLFTDPANGDFTLKKDLNCGDPRWIVSE